MLSLRALPALLGLPLLVRSLLLQRSLLLRLRLLLRPFALRSRGLRFALLLAFLAGFLVVFLSSSLALIKPLNALPIRANKPGFATATALGRGTDLTAACCGFGADRKSVV